MKIKFVSNKSKIQDTRYNFNQIKFSASILMLATKIKISFEGLFLILAKESNKFPLLKHIHLNDDHLSGSFFNA